VSSLVICENIPKGFYMALDKQMPDGSISNELLYRTVAFANLISLETLEMNRKYSEMYYLQCD
jgi:hypothetical protein